MTNSNANKSDKSDLATYITPFLVHASHGGIDIEGSIAKFSTELNAYTVEYQRQTRKIRRAIHEAFDTAQKKNPDEVSVRMSSSILTAKVLQTLQIDPDQFDYYLDLIKDFVQHDPAFSVNRGRGGGVRRKSEAEIKAEQAAAARGLEDADQEEDEEEEEELEATPSRRNSAPAPRISTPAPSIRSTNRPPSIRAARA